MSEREGREALRRNGFSVEEADAAIRNGIDAGLIDDRVLAKLWIEDRFLHHPLSRRAVERDLEGKGIPRGVISAELDAAYPPTKEREIAQRLAEARWPRYAADEPSDRLRRTADHLMRRGFSRGIAVDAVRRVEKERAGDV